MKDRGPGGESGGMPSRAARLFLDAFPAAVKRHPIR
jgi:hypothetical protein